MNALSSVHQAVCPAACTTDRPRARPLHGRSVLQVDGAFRDVTPMRTAAQIVRQSLENRREVRTSAQAHVESRHTVPVR